MDFDADPRAPTAADLRCTEPFSGAKGARTLEVFRPDLDCSTEAGVAPAKLRRSLDVVPVFGVVAEFRTDATELRDPRRESKGWRAPPPRDVRPTPCEARRAFHSSNCLRRSCAASFPLGSGARNDIACVARPALSAVSEKRNGHLETVVPLADFIGNVVFKYAKFRRFSREQILT